MEIRVEQWDLKRGLRVRIPFSALLYFFVFFFKQKTAYEIKECDWSSDVCSSDLSVSAGALAAFGLSHLRKVYYFFTIVALLILMVRFYPKLVLVIPYFILMKQFHLLDTLTAIKIGRASCRERV